MSLEGTGPSARRQTNVRLFPSRTAKPRDRRTASADCRVVGGELYVTLDLPHIDDAELRYAIRRRYILVWGDKSAHNEQYLIMLPVRVDPSGNVVRFQNGVFDARIKVLEAS